MTAREQDSPHQIQFYFDKPGQVRLSNRIDTWDFGTIVVDFLTERAIWKEIPQEGQLLLIEAGEEEEAYLLDRNSWQKMEYVDIDEGEYEPFAATIIVVPYALDKISKEGYEELFVRALSYVNPDSGGFFLLEKVGSDGDLAWDKDLTWRKDILKKVGLSNRKIFTSQKKDHEQLVWAGRLHKERSEPQPIDMTEPGSAYYSRARKKWGIMVRHYREMGYQIIEPEKSALLAKIKSSKYPYFDLELIDQKRGVKLLSTCGCKWKVPFKHEWERIYHCPDKECSGKSKIPGVLYNLKEPVEAKGSYCYKCDFNGQPRYKKYYKIQTKGNQVELGCEIFCKHCGLSTKPKNIWVRADQIVK